MAPALLQPALASDAAFFAIFGVFVAAMLVLVVVVLVWAIRRDKAGRAAWLQRQGGTASGPPNGKAP